MQMVKKLLSPFCVEGLVCSAFFHFFLYIFGRLSEKWHEVLYDISHLLKHKTDVAIFAFTEH